MGDAHHRKKEPERVRRQVLDAAAMLVAQEGVAAMTLDRVAAAAGLSKGGLLHHYPSRISLVDALFDDCLEQFEVDLDQRMRSDPTRKGRFTRAYLAALAPDDLQSEQAHSWIRVMLLLLPEPRLRLKWHEWTERREQHYVGTDSLVEARIVRLAADGLWLSGMLESQRLDAKSKRELIERLVVLSRT